MTSYNKSDGLWSDSFSLNIEIDLFSWFYPKQPKNDTKAIHQKRQYYQMHCNA